MLGPGRCAASTGPSGMDGLAFLNPHHFQTATQEIPFHLVGDDAFALKMWLMKPYAHLSQIHNERVFSYRLSRARRVVENTFGILQQRWRIFSTTLLVRPRVVRLITICACLLHNLQLQRQPPQPQNLDREDDNHNIIPGSWRDMPDLMVDLIGDPGMRNSSRDAKAVRNYLATYYASAAGAVPWQDRIIYQRGRPANE